MPALGADYSEARPGGAALAAAGVTAVGRYLADDSRGITQAEYQDLVSHGLAVWLVREGSGQEAKGGYASGNAQAVYAEQLLAKAGLPANAFVFYTVDYDAPASDYPTLDEYFRGASETRTPSVTGAYGPAPYLRHLQTLAYVTKWWQAAGWVDGITLPYVDIVQMVTNPPLPGTDRDLIYSANFGQIGGGITPPDPSTGDDAIMFAVPQLAKDSSHGLLKGGLSYIVPDNGPVRALDSASWGQLEYWNSDQALKDKGYKVFYRRDEWDPDTLEALCYSIGVCEIASIETINGVTVPVFARNANGDINVLYAPK